MEDYQELFSIFVQLRLVANKPYLYRSEYVKCILEVVWHVANNDEFIL